MELREFFSGNWRALILVPAATAIIAGVLFVSSADEKYESTAVISITEYLPGDSPAAVRASIDDFDSALESRQVREIVAANAPAAETYRISADAVGEGGDVQVRFVAPSRAGAEAALDAGVREALTLVSESLGRQSGRRLVAADGVASDPVLDLQDIEAAAGAADLEAELARRSGDLLALRNQIAAAAGNSIVQGALRSTLEEKQAEIQAIEAQLLPWTNARARFDLAVAAGADSSLELRQIETNESDLQTDDLLQSLRTPQVSNVPDLLRVVVAATAVTAGAVVLIAMLLGSDRRRRFASTVTRHPERTPGMGWFRPDPIVGEASTPVDREDWDDWTSDDDGESREVQPFDRAGDGDEEVDEEVEDDDEDYDDEYDDEYDDDDDEDDDDEYDDDDDDLHTDNRADVTRSER